MLAACASPPPVPPWFDSIQRIPVHTVTVQGQRIAYLDEGRGLPVILIHGYGGSMWQWEYQQAALAARLRVITLDLVGAGLSDKPDIEYRPDQILEYFVGFMDALKLPRAALVGHSMGAGIAIGMALAHPERVTDLVLIGGLPDQVLDKLGSPTIRRALTTGAPSWLISIGNRLLGGAVLERVLREIVYDQSLLTQAVLDRSDRNRHRPGLFHPIKAAGRNLPLWEEGYAKRIGEIRRRTLIIWGEEDRVFPASVGEDLHRRIDGSQLFRVPQAGHVPQWERPRPTNERLLQFLAP